MRTQPHPEEARIELPTDLIVQKVLDHGACRYVDHMGSDASIVASARMSTGRGFVSWEPYERCKKCEAVSGRIGAEALLAINGAIKDPCSVHDGTQPVDKFPRGDLGFLEFLYSGRYLTEPAHIGPFDQGDLIVEQEHPILVERQYARHRTLIALFQINEFSARYSVLPDLFYVPSRERLHNAAQDMKNRQGSAAGLSEETVVAITEKIVQAHAQAREMYEALLGLGLSKELARGVIGVFQYTKVRRKANLRNWLQAAELRLDLHAQWEAQETFVPVKKLLSVLWPYTWGLFEEYTLGALRFSRTEAGLLRRLMQIATSNGCSAASDVLELLSAPVPGSSPFATKAHRDAFLKKLGIEG